MHWPHLGAAVKESGTLVTRIVVHASLLTVWVQLRTAGRSLPVLLPRRKTACALGFISTHSKLLPSQAI